MTNFRSFALALVSVFSIAAISASSVHAATELARVNSTVITLEDFNKKYKENLRFFQFKAPTRKGVLEDLIKRELGIQEAKKMGLDKDPEVIERMQNELYKAMLDKKLGKEFEKITVTDEESKKWYEKNPELRTSHIFIAVAPDATAADQKKAYDQIKSINDEHVRPGKEGFAEVAQKYSEGSAAPMGGDVDFQTKDRLDPAYYEAAVALRTPGKISGIVRSQFGYHIIKLTAVKSWLEADRGQIKRMIFEEKRLQVYERLMGQLRGQAKVVVKNDLIKD